MKIKKLKATANQRYYEIENTDDLLDIISLLYNKTEKNNKLYKYNNKYYLELFKTIPIKNFTPKVNFYLKGQLEEYGKLICNDAIAIIGSKIKEP